MFILMIYTFSVSSSFPQYSWNRISLLMLLYFMSFQKGRISLAMAYKFWCCPSLYILMHFLIVLHSKWCIFEIGSKCINQNTIKKTVILCVILQYSPRDLLFHHLYIEIKLLYFIQVLWILLWLNVTHNKHIS